MDGGSSMEALSLEDNAPPTLDTLPDDVLRLLWRRLLHTHEHDKMIARGVGHAFALFSVSRRLRALSKILVTDLRLAPWKSSTRPRDDGSTGFLRLPLAGHRTTGPAYSLSQSGSLLAPFGWAARLSSLRALQISRLTWHGAARLITLLPAWPQLEVLDCRFSYSLSTSLGDDAEQFATFANDLASVLRLGALKKLRLLFLGSLNRNHCYGQLDLCETDDGSDLLDDTVILEALNPTAALWWMAERARHARCSKLHQWRYEIEHGADLGWRTPEGLSLLQWMCQRLNDQVYSHAGHLAVHTLLVANGAVEEEPFQQAGGNVETEQYGENEYDTDYEDRNEVPDEQRDTPTRAEREAVKLPNIH